MDPLFDFPVIEEPIWLAVAVHALASTVACGVLISMCVKNIASIDKRMVRNLFESF